MVKNESAILRRLLESVRLSVQAAVICDTGSTDSTVAVAQGWLLAMPTAAAEAGIPGAVYTYPFTNFGESRTESFRRCQSWVAEQGWPAAETWCLALDGDMVLEGIVVPSDLNVDADVAGISLKQVNGGLVYGNLRLLRMSEGWVCRGSTHEAWVCPPGRRTTTLAAPVIQDLNDGGSRADKFERDVRLLREDLVAAPDDARTLFYLGQTYKSMGRFEEAREVLLKRIEVGGWDEETYIARVYLGDCSDGDQAVTAWLAAWESRPARSEAALRLVRWYRKKPRSQFIASMFLEKLFLTQFGEEFASGVRVSEPLQTTDTLFVDTWGVAVGLWIEMGILGYYTGRREVTRLRLDEWDLTANVSWSDSNSVLGNFHWYQVLEGARQKVQMELPVSSLPWSDEEEAYIWLPFNPSIRLESDGYTLNLRYANYSTENAATTMYRGMSGKVITRNCLIRIPGEEWRRPESVREVIVTGATERKDSHVLGVEDCRFIQGSVESEPLMLGTSVSYTADGVNKMFMVVGSGSAWTLSPMPLPAGVAVDVCQKNWLGFFHLGELLYIYAWDPYRVCDAGGKTRVSGAVSGSEATAYSLAGYRGSAAPVAWRSVAFPDERYLCAVHKVYSGSEGRRYYQRFVTLGSDLRPSRISCFLRMTTKKVEYWSGLCPSLGRRPGLIESYWLAYGLDDSQAWLAEIGAAEIEARLWYDARKGVGVPFSSRKSS
jgi:tetratricopeptide (TPR) repeat protein